MIRVGICNDEKKTVEILKAVVQECLIELKVEAKIVTCGSGKEVLEEAEELDVVFWDSEMLRMNGVEKSKKVKELGCKCEIVIGTGTEEHFKKAFIMGAFRFVTIPVQKKEIKEALEAFLQTRVGMKKIKLYRKRNLYTFFQKDIIYMKAINSAVEFVLKEGVFRKETSLSELEKNLDDKLFYRVNRQYIINLNKIEKYETGKILLSGLEIKVSERRKKEFERTYMKLDVDYE